MTLILLARHGETDWNRSERWQGHADPPLNATGLSQAEALADLLAEERLHAIYSSDLQRAVSTAEAVARRHALPLVQLERLREIDVGEWSGLTTTEIKEQHAEGFERHNAGGDGWLTGEPHAEMQKRIVAAIDALAQAHEDETILVVIHGGTIRALLAHAMAIPFDEYRRTYRGPRNGTVARVSVESGRWVRID